MEESSESRNEGEGEPRGEIGGNRFQVLDEELREKDTVAIMVESEDRRDANELGVEIVKLDQG